MKGAHKMKKGLKRNLALILAFVMIMSTGITNVFTAFADDSVPVKADVYFDIIDGANIDMTRFDTVNGHDAVFGIRVEVSGSYEIKFTATSELSDIAQIPMTLFYTSIPLKVFTWNGSNGKETSQSVNMFCGGQPAIIRLHFATPGVKLLRAEVKFISKADDSTPWGGFAE